MNRIASWLECIGTSIACAFWHHLALQGQTAVNPWIKQYCRLCQQGSRTQRTAKRAKWNRTALCHTKPDFSRASHKMHETMSTTRLCNNNAKGSKTDILKWHKVCKGWTRSGTGNLIGRWPRSHTCEDLWCTVCCDAVTLWLGLRLSVIKPQKPVCTTMAPVLHTRHKSDLHDVARNARHEVVITQTKYKCLYNYKGWGLINTKNILFMHLSNSFRDCRSTQVKS